MTPTDAATVGLPVPTQSDASHIDPAIAAVTQGHHQIGSLLQGLQESAPMAPEAAWSAVPSQQNQLAEVRLGIATSLFYALRAKHAPTAAHGLRVAMWCSAWSVRLNLDTDTRDRIEVAALFHDLGKIGIPDRILRKPGKLTEEEQLTMECCPLLGREILKGSTSDKELLDIVQFSGTWFQSTGDAQPAGSATLPLGSRMIAIADAFDAMTSDTVYRRAMSRERAIQEILDGSGRQFDPELALDFHQMMEQHPDMLHQAVVDRWLTQLRSNTDHASLWGPTSESPRYVVRKETLFSQQLLNQIHVGVVFTDGEGTITHWNSAMQQLTGIPGESVIGQRWNERCWGFQSEDDQSEDGVVAFSLANTSPVTRLMSIDRNSSEPKSSEPIPVLVKVSPVLGTTPEAIGTVITVHDQSEQSKWAAQIETLHQQISQDPLTGAMHREACEEVLEKMVADSSTAAPPFAMIKCDLDHFKQINDQHGLPAGDETLRSIVSILNTSAQPDDVIARVGGEEFVVLIPECDNATATNRAESIRAIIADSPMPCLSGKTVTASFGVTEFQPGDSVQTIMARVDRAVLKAKDNGRNRVVQLGSGRQHDVASSERKKSWRDWFASKEEPTQDADFDIVTSVPIHLAVDKLRGFIADHDAEILDVKDDHVILKLDAGGRAKRRRADQPIGLKLHLTLSELHDDKDQARGYRKTNVHVHMQPLRTRNQGTGELSERFSQVLHSLRSYLMGEFRGPESS